MQGIEKLKDQLKKVVRVLDKKRLTNFEREFCILILNDMLEDLNARDGKGK